jgi:hypothetical protein
VAIKLILSIPIWIPSILERALIRLVQVLRRVRYGYAFRRIALTQGKYAIVDPEDFDRLNTYKWHAKRVPGRFYAGRTGPRHKGKPGPVILMHREILDVGRGMVVDHINHDGLDNRKANLRPATLAQNSRNRRKVKTAGHYSKYKGLTWYKSKQKWGAMIMANRKSKFLGYFDDEVEAARAYDVAARELHGEFAALNFPDK